MTKPSAPRNIHTFQCSAVLCTTQYQKNRKISTLQYIPSTRLSTHLTLQTFYASHAPGFYASHAPDFQRISRSGLLTESRRLQKCHTRPSGPTPASAVPAKLPKTGYHFLSIFINFLSIFINFYQFLLGKRTFPKLHISVSIPISFIGFRALPPQPRRRRGPKCHRLIENFSSRTFDFVCLPNSKFPLWGMENVRGGRHLVLSQSLICQYYVLYLFLSHQGRGRLITSQPLKGTPWFWCLEL